MKDCPFCGHPMDMADPDTLYPTGTGWKLQPNGIKSYHSFHAVPKEQWCYSIHCVTTSGGCGVEISGDSAQECIDRWNKRV